MKKVDFHIHTVATISDSYFDFSIDRMKEYVAHAGLDAIAITNHDVFDLLQFREIVNALEVKVFPGIEVNLNSGHVLIIADGQDLDGFEQRTNVVAQKIQKVGDSISVEELGAIFGDLKSYLIIPHYDKKPPVSGEELEALRPYISAGEVDSAKKFIRNIKDAQSLTPVLFSDIRIRQELSKFPSRQTFIDCGELSLNAIKNCLRDKAKVALSRADGNNLFTVLDDGQQLSTGLNILFGERSSGKTHTLDAIFESIENVKYIEQFSLVQLDDGATEKQFLERISRDKSLLEDEFLAPFKTVVSDILTLDLEDDHTTVETYVESLLKSAAELERKDSFSNTALFDESEFGVKESKILPSLIEAARHLIENVEYREVIKKHVELSSLRSLVRELIEALWEFEKDRQKKIAINSAIKTIQAQLQLKTAVTPIESVDLYQIVINTRKVERFREIVEILKSPAEIRNEPFHDFRVVARKGPFEGAGELKARSGRMASFAEAYRAYDDPYAFLQALREIDVVREADLSKFFTRIDYTVLNGDGATVSGGEMSEFRLLQEIKDAQRYDILLIDEPESSFDNVFLNRAVNRMIKTIAQTMPVVVETHNSTIGASIKADYFVYTRKDRENDKVTYRRYSGFPTDKQLKSVDGQAIDNFDVIMNSLEAGDVAYNERRGFYETFKN